MKYYYHGVSHHLGLDCHDLCEYTPLEAGAIITCEPGLYIAEENIEAIKKIHSRDIPFVICTGKSYSVSKSICEKLSLRGVFC